jgi:hypothetical protein
VGKDDAMDENYSLFFLGLDTNAIVNEDGTGSRSRAGKKLLLTWRRAHSFLACPILNQIEKRTGLGPHPAEGKSSQWQWAGEKSSAFGRGNVVAKIVRFPPADLEKADRFRSAPRKAKNQAGCGSEGSAKENSIALFVQISVESGTLEPTIADSKSGQV